MNTTKRGRPRGDKVHFQARVTPAMVTLFTQIIKGDGSFGLVKGSSIPMDKEGDLNQKALLEDIDRLTKEVASRDEFIVELQAGITDRLVQDLRFKLREYERRIRQLENQG